MQFKVTSGNTEELIKQYFWLAWNACGGPLGMGVLQNCPAATIDDVFENVKSAGDYPGHPRTRAGVYYGDYVFGRMMKAGMKLNNGIVEVRENDARPDYQAWCTTYADEVSLLQAAAEAADCTLEQV